MKSFFSRLQGHFKNRDEGRYLGILLSELVVECPDMLGDLFANGKQLATEMRKGSMIARSEWSFECAAGTGRKRIADFALIDASDGHCCALLEIKMEDSELDGQFSDYRAYAEQGKKPIPFTVLCKYVEPKNVPVAAHRKIQKTLSLAEYARVLSLGKCRSNYAVALFLSYIKDMGIMFSDVQSSDIRMLLRKLFHERKGGGRIAAKNNIGTRIPDAFASVLNNQFAITEQFRSRLGRYRSSVDFSIQLESPPKHHADGYIDKCGGYLDVYTRVAIFTGSKVANDWLYLCYGLTFELNDKDQPVLSAYAEITGRRLDSAHVSNGCLSAATGDRSFRMNYKPETVDRLISGQVLRAIEQANEMTLPAHYRAALRRLEKELAA